MTEIEMFRGAMIGGACGDALGYPLQELSVCRIQHKYGPFGLRTLVRNGQCGNLAPVTGFCGQMQRNWKKQKGCTAAICAGFTARRGRNRGAGSVHG